MDVGHGPGSEGYCVQVWTEMADVGDPVIRVTGLDDEVKLLPDEADELGWAVLRAAQDAESSFPRSSPLAVASADTAQHGAVPEVKPLLPGLASGAGPCSGEGAEVAVSGDAPLPAGAEAPAGGDAVDPDDTSRCPLGPCCETCGGADELAVATAGSVVGVFCMTLCQRCADNGRIPGLTAGAAVRRVMAHAGHLGCTVDDLAITDSRK